ncbi:MAG: LacI family DNA-binding transcriptional regulator [Lentisphaeria bacterium]|nr:LacI family DNA-binding transcriptional regulator [Lentisphaeria bacterium]
MKIQQIAALAGVSTATVSRVFSHHPNIRKEVREHVLNVARQYSYRPRSSGKQKNIVIIVPYRQIYPASEFVDMVTSELIRELAQAGYRIELLPLDNLERLEEIAFCGAVGIGIDVPEKWDERFALPLIIIDKIPARRVPGVSFVHSDEKQGMDIAITHLAEHGCRKAGAILHGLPGKGNVDVRKKAVLQALKKNGLPFDDRLVRVTLEENFLEEMGKLLQLGIDGAFCGGGGTFGGIAAYALSLFGKKIPQDIRLVSSERQRISRYCIPPQTTITPDYEKTALAVAEQLDKMISGREFQPEVILPYSLIVRDSSQ